MTAKKPRKSFKQQLKAMTPEELYQKQVEWSAIFMNEALPFGRRLRASEKLAISRGDFEENNIIQNMKERGEAW
ncbi:MAG: hypothetical protein HQK62_14905 [Desulfamplus sp.]|nr:hypothetical protein [Desulfamplus sp.]